MDSRYVIAIGGICALFAPHVLSACCNHPRGCCDADGECATRTDGLGYCVAGHCAACRDDEHCAGPCQRCGADRTCEAVRDCCLDDGDCPSGGRCWRAEATGAAGRCGPQCDPEDPEYACPGGLECRRGRCVAPPPCTADDHCPPRHRCVAERCEPACEVVPVYYDYDAFTVRADQADQVRANAACVRLRGEPITVEGHCDERGSDEYNLVLGQRRAVSLQRQYVTLGVAADHIRVISYGRERPVCARAEERCHLRNRRAETVSLGDSASF